jgi:hypothetical protein
MNRVELSIGQKARIEVGKDASLTTKHVVVAEGWGCDKCPLSSTKQCLENHFRCFRYQRTDNKDVHFEEVKDADRKV